MLGNTAGGVALATTTYGLYSVPTLPRVLLAGTEVDASRGTLCNAALRLCHSAPDFLRADGLETVGQGVWGGDCLGKGGERQQDGAEGCVELHVGMRRWVFGLVLLGLGCLGAFSLRLMSLGILKPNI